MTFAMPLRLRRFCQDQSGAVAVEFVLIAPILISLLFGIISLGYFMGVSHSVHQLAASAARVSVAGLTQDERSGLATTYLSQAGERYPLLSQKALSPNVVFDNAEPAGVTVTVAYNVEGTLLDVANSFLNLELTSIKGSAYLAY